MYMHTSIGIVSLYSVNSYFIFRNIRMFVSMEVLLQNYVSHTVTGFNTINSVWSQYSP